MSDETSVRSWWTNPILKEFIVEELVGEWKVTIKMTGLEAEWFCQVGWVLNHQFLLVQFVDADTKRFRDREEKPKPAEYEGDGFHRYDNMSER